MSDTKIGSNSLTRAAERVRKQREAERAGGVSELTPIAPVKGTTTQMRAKLNVVPNNDAIKSLVDQALTALSRGIRWARGSIINLIV
jgi:hypothetical protein